MTTIEDKLKLFAKVVFENVEKESQKKIMDTTAGYDKYLEEEKQNILKESENMIKQMKKKAESKKQQIISKANIDRQHALLKKRKELFDRTLEDIKNLADSFTSNEEYIPFLEKCIENCLSKINADDVYVFFKPSDIEKYSEKINAAVDKFKKPGTKVEIKAFDKDMLGGCICEDKNRTIRINCSMSAIIDDNRTLIGKMLMDNLQQSR